MLTDKVYLGALGAVTGRGHNTFKIAFYCIYKLLPNQNNLAVDNYIGTSKIGKLTLS